MNKIPTLSDKELIKWSKILGIYKIKELYIYSKITLTGEQVDLLNKIEKEDEDEKFKNK